MQNRAIEIHDSTLDSISIQNADAVLHFSAVYIHQSEGIPLVDAGSGWVQEALLRIGAAQISGSISNLPNDILGGQIILGKDVLENEIPIPLSYKGIVEIRLESWNDEVILISGDSAELELIGESKYVEEFRP